MKKTLLILVFAIVAIAAKAQTYTVIDTVVKDDQKHQIVATSLDRMQKTLGKVFDQEKVETGTITFANETRSLLAYFAKGYAQYASLWNTFDTLTYEKIACDPYEISSGQTIGFDYYLNGDDSTGVGLIHEWDQLNVRIEELQTDEDIKYVDAVKEFQDIKDRQAILQKRYQSIKSQ